MHSIGLFNRAPLDLTRIDPRFFTQSLLQEGVRAGAVSRENLERIQQELLALLQETIQRYTKGQSSSVREETAQRLMNSNLYTIDFALREASGPEEALRLLRQTPIRVLYRRGFGQLQRRIGAAEKRYRRLIATMETYGLFVCQDTLGAGLSGFFRHYDPNFDATEHLIGPDYPTAIPLEQERGIVRIERYLERLELEQRFCGAFSPEAIVALLEQYGRQNRTDYHELMINTMQLVWNQAIAAMLWRGACDSLRLEEAACSGLEKRLAALEAAELERVWQTAANRVTQELGMEKSVAQYLSQVAAKTWPMFQRAARTENVRLFAVVVSQAQEETMKAVSGPQMDNAKFRTLAEELRTCASAEEKAALVQAEVSSVEDLLDLLSADCFFGEEYPVIFALLEDAEIAVIFNRIFPGEAAEVLDHGVFGELHFTAGEEEWIAQLLDYLAHLPEVRLSEIF